MSLLSVLGTAFLALLMLKLGGIGAVAVWSWWWVTAPLWGGFLIFVWIWANERA